MKLSEIKNILDARILTAPENWENIEVKSAFGCDLMSDVLAFVTNQSMLLTGLVNPQVIRTAEMMDIKVITFVRGKTPAEEIIELAKELGISILSTEKTLYVACGKLYMNGLSGKED